MRKTAAPIMTENIAIIRTAKNIPNSTSGKSLFLTRDF